MKRRVLVLLISLDLFVFALLTRGGCKRNQTMSAAAWEMEKLDKWQGRLLRPLIDGLLMPFQTNHCHICYEAEHHTWM